MGDVWLPDQALTLDVLLVSLELLEEDWVKATDAASKLEISLTGAMMALGYLAGLRGEEIPLTELGGLRKHWSEGVECRRKTHVPLVLAGRFKRQVGPKVYIQPLTPVSKSGIKLQLWMERAISVYQALGVSKGPLYRVATKKGKIRRATISDLDVLLHNVLRRVQARRPDLIPETVKVEDECSVRRSLRRGVTTKSQNRGIPKEVIDAPPVSESAQSSFS